MKRLFFHKKYKRNTRRFLFAFFGLMAPFWAGCAANPIWGLVDESFYTGQKSKEELQKEREAQLAQLSLGIAAASPTSASSSSPPRAFKYIFLTASTYQGGLTGSSGNVSEIDAKCNSDANRPDTTVSYKALIAVGGQRIACTSANCLTNGSSEHTDWVLAANQEYRRSDATTVIGTTTAFGIFNLSTGSLTNSFATTTDQYWSGLLDDWTISVSGNCVGGRGDWSSSLNSDAGRTGDESATDTTAISFGTSLCDISRSLLCVEQ